MLNTPVPTLLDEITDFLVVGRSTEEILAFQVSATLDERLHDLLERNRKAQISLDEQAELDEFIRMDHLITMLKLKARLRLI
jgi:hypothetical protein